MKKLAMIAAVAVAGSVFADSGIESANIVGYVTSPTITANKVSLGTMPFSSAGSELVKIQDLVAPNAEPCQFKNRATQAVQLQVWNGSAYTVYYYVSDAYDEESDEELTGWANNKGDLVNDEYAPGTGYWYKYPVSDSTYVLPGQVVSQDSVTKNVYATKLNLVGNPYPMSLSLSKISTSVTAPAFKNRATQAVQLQIWNGSAYNLYYYVSDAYDEESDEELTGWANNKGDYVDATGLDATFGLWAKSPAADGTITFSK